MVICPRLDVMKWDAASDATSDSLMVIYEMMATVIHEMDKFMKDDVIYAMSDAGDEVGQARE